MFEPLIKLPKPRNDAEFAILTKWYFGKSLTVSFHVYNDGVQYDIFEKFDSIQGKLKKPLQYKDKFENYFSNYDYSGSFFRQVFGKLSCGGVAGSSYGQTKGLSHRDKKRLKHWQKSKNDPSLCTVRKVFTRLAQQ